MCFTHRSALWDSCCADTETIVIKSAITTFASPQLPPNPPGMGGNANHSSRVPSPTHQRRVTTSACLLLHSCKKTIASE